MRRQARTVNRLTVDPGMRNNLEQLLMFHKFDLRFSLITLQVF